MWEFGKWKKRKKERGYRKIPVSSCPGKKGHSVNRKCEPCEIALPSSWERWAHFHAEHLPPWERREKGNAERVREPASHKSPTASEVRQMGSVSKLFLGVKGRGGRWQTNHCGWLKSTRLRGWSVTLWHRQTTSASFAYTHSPTRARVE